MSTDDKFTWAQAYYFEHRVVNFDATELKREFRCPVCHDPLFIGQARKKEETTSEGWKWGPGALICSKTECRTYLKLMDLADL